MVRPLWLATASVVAALVLAGCGGVEPTIDIEPGIAPDDDAIVYDCFGVTMTAADLREAPAVADLDDHPARSAFAAATGDLEGWRAVDVDDDRIAAVRELDPPDVLDGHERDFERLEVVQFDEPAPPETDDEGWAVGSSGPCALQADLGGLGSAAVHLDGAPDPARAAIDLLVVEQACASGQDAEDRVEAAVDEDDGEVRLVVGVRPLGGDQACPSNPATPVTVELSDPVGERGVVDAARYPPREITEAPTDLWRGD